MARRKTGARAWVRVSHKSKGLPASKRRWEVVYEDPANGFKRRTKGGFRNKAEAEAWRDDFTQEARQGSWVDPARGDVEFRQVAQDWLATYTSPSGKARGYAQHAAIVNGKGSLLVQEFGSVRIGDITHSAVGTWISGMQQGRSASTIRHYFYTLRSVMRYAVAEGLITRDPTAGWRTPQPRDMAAEEADRYALSMGEVEALIVAVPEPWDMYLRLLAATGMRPEEVGGLQLRDVDPEQGALSVRRVLVKIKGKLVLEDMLKTRRSRRTIDLDTRTAGLLGDYIAAHQRRATRWFSDNPNHPHPGDQLPLFVGVTPFERGQSQRKTGTDLDWLDYSRHVDHRWFVERHWATARKAAKVPEGVRPYDLRHFHASWHVARLGQPGALTITEVSERLGHASTAMTLDRYSHSARDREEQRRSALDAMWTPEPGVTRLPAARGVSN